MSFSKVLIANRGEIACRVARSVRALGLRSVAIYSEADAGALHVDACDEAVAIGGTEARQSYLNIDAILEAARRSGADAIHPGYGFLSENELFASACNEAGLVFIGPPPSAIRAMGNKAAAKRLMIEAGVPCVPGYEGQDQSEATMLAEAARIGYPVMVKAAAGGGGRGMRLVAGAGEMARALAGARSEAESAFGSGELILEKAVAEPRHVEIQVFADRHGNVIHLGERDCSIQRRHQKVIEEAPSPAVSTELREAMGEAAVQAARAIDYVGAGTVEFLLDGSGRFYFLEMNTRLQVEHPVTEMITGLDLVALQIDVAAGHRLPLEQHQLRLQGHAIEARLYAEDPARGFLPQSGWVELWAPAEGAGIRIDHGLKSRQEITPYYDPMIAKVIAHGRSREEARRRLIRALEDTAVFGPATNRRFLCDILAHDEFAKGAATTGFIARHFPPAVLGGGTADEGLPVLAAALLAWQRTGDRDALAAGWRSTGPADWPLRLEAEGIRTDLRVSMIEPRRMRVSQGETGREVRLVEIGEDRVRFEIDGLRRDARLLFRGERIFLACGRRSACFEETLHRARGRAEAGSDGRVAAPMNGRIVTVLARPGATVRRGERLLVLEAMKMQHEITAQVAGTVARVEVREGDQVATRQLLVEITPEPAAG
ncbi:MAG: acetyl-CoA carboxylase biotin carboxylase subunit [Alphaproteobacteria bacterium]|nr:acetyl-CoA carboxylase biotin carboxylase subunit [Alphaproteobacteria bacterium]